MTTKQSGLSIDQIDALTLELSYAKALAEALHADADGSQDTSFNTLLKRQLDVVEAMIEDCQIGGRRRLPSPVAVE